MFGPLDKLASPRYFYAFAEYVIPWATALCAVLIVFGIYQGLWLAPIDFQQGNSYRIIFIHVPSAWLSLLTYTSMATVALIGLVWKLKLAHVFAQAAAPAGVAFTLVTLVTGAIWGKPTWGSWWVWDARLTSELILLFLYLGFIALQEAIDDPKLAWRSGSVLLLVGMVNIPIIHYSVEWWNTLHQPASILKFGAPSIHPKMLWPLLTVAVAFMVLCAVIVMMRMQTLLLQSNANKSWVKEMLVNK